MVLQQPFLERLAAAKSVLLAGCGGGYDILGAVPLAVELWERGCQVHFASLSFCYLNGLDGTTQDAQVPNLYAVPSSAATAATYCPEAWLARWLGEKLGRAQPVWGFDKTGVRPLLAAYRRLVEQLALDSIVLVDGGIDALLRGDESCLGTPAEDLASIAAVSQLEGVPSFLACIGFGAELRDGICHAQALDRIAELTREHGYLGCAALLGDDRAGALYLEAVRYVFEHQAEQRQSHIHTVVSAAASGEFGERGPHVWLSPLASTYWLFDLAVVARTNLLVGELRETDTIRQVSAVIEGARKGMEIQRRSAIPL
jgi:hypothetical protein